MTIGLADLKDILVCRFGIGELVRNEIAVDGAGAKSHTFSGTRRGFLWALSRQPVRARAAIIVG